MDGFWSKVRISATEFVFDTTVLAFCTTGIVFGKTGIEFGTTGLVDGTTGIVSSTSGMVSGTTETVSGRNRVICTFEWISASFVSGNGVSNFDILQKILTKLLYVKNRAFPLNFDMYQHNILHSVININVIIQTFKK